eukprot:603223-Pyramimonas_sp.AAC.1
MHADARRPVRGAEEQNIPVRGGPFPRTMFAGRQVSRSRAFARSRAQSEDSAVGQFSQPSCGVGSSF